MDYREFAADIGIYQSADENDPHLLDPNLFHSLFAAGSIDAVCAYVALPKILRLIQLRRTLGQTMDVGLNLGSIVIGDQIPRVVGGTGKLRPGLKVTVPFPGARGSIPRSSRSKKTNRTFFLKTTYKNWF